VLPAQDLMRTGFPGEFEHFAAYAGSAAIAIAGYGFDRSRFLIIGSFWLYAGILEYLQHFSPGRHPAFLDFSASALGALSGGVGHHPPLAALVRLGALRVYRLRWAAQSRPRKGSAPTETHGAGLLNRQSRERPFPLPSLISLRLGATYRVHQPEPRLRDGRQNDGQASLVR
jgi:hypothetical protein